MTGSMMHYSGWQLVKQGLAGNNGWKPAWRTPDLQRSYDAVVVGGGVCDGVAGVDCGSGRVGADDRRGRR